MPDNHVSKEGFASEIQWYICSLTSGHHFLKWRMSFILFHGGAYFHMIFWMTNFLVESFHFLSSFSFWARWITCSETLVRKSEISCGRRHVLLIWISKLHYWLSMVLSGLSSPFCMVIGNLSTKQSLFLGWTDIYGVEGEPRTLSYSLISTNVAEGAGVNSPLYLKESKKLCVEKKLNKRDENL